VAGAAAAGATAPAAADSTPSPDPVDPGQPPIGNDEEREAPDYDGRGDEPTTAGDVFVWIPRTIFMPVYLVSEYVLRWPIGKLVSAIDENDVIDVVGDFFTFGPGDNSGLVPSFLIDFGFRPSIGLYFFTNDTLWKGNTINSHVAFGGVDWWRATATVRHTISEEDANTTDKLVQAKFVFSHRPDWQYFGTGPETVTEQESRFTAQEINGILTYDGGLDWRSSWLRADAGVRDVSFKEDTCCDTIALPEAVANGFYPKPEHFDDGYMVGFVGVNAALDTRPRRNAYEGEASDYISPAGSGIKLAGRVQVAGGFRDSEIPVNGAIVEEKPAYVSYGGTVGGFVDVYNQRVIGLQVIADFVDPMADDGVVPFFDLVSLGGSRPLRGFLQRRLLGRSSIVGQLEYRWPIWAYLDGTLHYAVGNVFGEHLEGFDASLFRQSFGAGIREISARDHSFEVLIAGGTETFDEGAEMDSFRFVFGGTTGF
jgi:hypothetical protein